MSERLSGTLSGRATITWLWVRTVRATGSPIAARISARGMALPAKSVSATGCSSGTDEATMTLAPVRWRRIEARFCMSKRSWTTRWAGVSPALSVLRRLLVMSRSKSDASADVAFSRSLAA